ncbi:MAG: N-acetyl-gamma-glutamyl-phosphate reductase [Deltaproteobacteria bacterium]|nr:MAG: N-acetyl-gamma-glutamyl-phosphate reductase [Deltaproteobacteria bacterium]
MIRVGVVGATGYVGGEVVRWVLSTPGLELAAVVSTRRAGQALSAAHPGLLGLCDLELTPFDAAALACLDAVILAVPHGESAALAASIGAHGDPILVDCAADHRHAVGWVYGQPEWAGSALRGARRIAAPGCFATALALALAPFAAAGLFQGEITAVAATGSTGSGASPSAGTHHPERFANLRAYKVLCHQHVPEVRTFLARLSGAPAPELAFVPLSAPVDRGILATCFFRCDEAVDPRAVLADAYAHAPGVRLRFASPELRFVRGTGFCDLTATRQGPIVTVISAIDNLGRGAAAQAIQALLLALGHEGPGPLRTSPLVP